MITTATLCPFCGKPAPEATMVCRSCGRTLPPLPQLQSVTVRSAPRPRGDFGLLLLCGLQGGVGFVLLACAAGVAHRDFYVSLILGAMGVALLVGCGWMYRHLSKVNTSTPR